MKLDFEQIIRENAGILHKLCRVYSNNESEYEEIFQEMMIQIWRAIPNFRGESQLSTWIYRICINTALNFRTKINKFKKSDLSPSLNSSIRDAVFGCSGNADVVFVH